MMISPEAQRALLALMQTLRLTDGSYNLVPPHTIMEFKFVSATLSCCLVASALAVAQSNLDSQLRDKTALIEPRGFVTVNGANIRDLQALFPGDKIRTGENARAIVEFKLATATVAANSCATYAPNFVEITCGTTLVRTKTGTTALVCTLSISPQSNDAEYVAIIGRGYVVVISKQGAQMLDTGKERILLDAGATFTRPRMELCRHRP
jgi:hypothetical protein